jgi:hypothetical protein
MEESMKLKVFQLSDWLHDIFWVIFIDAEKKQRHDFALCPALNLVISFHQNFRSPVKLEETKHLSFQD